MSSTDQKTATPAVESPLDVPTAGGHVWVGAGEFLTRRNTRWLGLLALTAVLIAIGASVYHIYVPIVGAYNTFVLRPLHLLLIGGLGFLSFNIAGRPRDFTRPGWSLLVDAVLLAVFAAALLHVLTDPVGFEERVGFGETTRWDIALGAALTFLVLELSRRCIGLPITIFVAAMLAYAFFGDDLPGLFKHRPLAATDIFELLYMTTFGIFGAPVGVMATYVFLFIIFGAFIERSKGGLLIQRVGLIAAGRSPGGPAKVAVLTSSVFGTMSGSALANVMATGSFTIPMMKRIGFKPHQAGAIEAAASSGGQIMPPIMGAVAFVMADITGIPYAQVILAAALPAVLFYLSLFVTVDLTARRQNMAGVPEEHMPKKGEVLALLHLVIPLAVLIAALIMGYSPMFAALAGIASTIVVAGLRRATRMSAQKILEGLNEAAQTTIIATVACAAAGIVVGVINITGLGLRLSSELINISQGSIAIALVLVMVTCVILGMGMPTVAAYIITIAIGGPVLEELGVPTIAAHLFVLYYAVLSLITPPVMVASFGAAALAKADVMWTGFAAVKFAALAFVMPFIFVYNPELLLIGQSTPLPAMLWLCTTAVCGAVLFGMAVSGHPTRSVIERVAVLGAAYLLVSPGAATDLYGLGLAAVVLLWRRVLVAKPALG